MGRKKNLKQKKILEEKEYTNSEKIVIIAIDTNEINDTKNPLISKKETTPMKIKDETINNFSANIIIDIGDEYCTPILLNKIGIKEQTNSQNFLMQKEFEISEKNEIKEIPIIEVSEKNEFLINEISIEEIINLNSQDSEPEKEIIPIVEIEKSEKISTPVKTNEKKAENLEVQLSIKDSIESFKSKNSTKKEIEENENCLKSTEFLSRYINFEENKLLSYKRRREEMINESYKSFGFSLDESDKLKKGFSKVEREKQIEKEKSETIQQENPEDSKAKNSENSEKYKKPENENRIKIPDSFMQDAKIKKSRIEIDKENFLVKQKNPENSLRKYLNLNLIEEKQEENLNLNENLNQKTLTFKEKKEAALKASNAEWGDFMTSNIKKKSRIELDKEKFYEEKKKVEEKLLKIKQSQIKSEFFKFDTVEMTSASVKKKEISNQSGVIKSEENLKNSAKKIKPFEM